MNKEELFEIQEYLIWEAENNGMTSCQVEKELNRINRLLMECE